MTEQDRQTVYVYETPEGNMTTTKPLTEAKLERAVAEHNSLCLAAEAKEYLLTDDERDALEFALRRVLAIADALEQDKAVIYEI